MLYELYFLNITLLSVFSWNVTVLFKEGITEDEGVFIIHPMTRFLYICKFSLYMEKFGEQNEHYCNAKHPKKLTCIFFYEMLVFVFVKWNIFFHSTVYKWAVSEEYIASIFRIKA